MEGEPRIDDLERAEQSENNEQFSSDEESIQENVDQDQDSDLPTNTLVSAKPSYNEIISSLQNICNHSEVNKDAKCLDNLQKVFDGSEASLMSKPHLNKVKSAFYKAGSSLKKRIFTETNINKQKNNEANENENENTSALISIAQDDDSNIFELLQNL